MEKINSTTWKHIQNDDWRERLEVVIGDDKQPEFKPQIKIEKWSNECNASFRLVDDEKGLSIIKKYAGKIKYIKPKKELHFYNIKPNEKLREGGFEMEIILKEKPSTNKLEFTIKTKGLKFYYQPPMTEEKLEEGQTADETHIYDKDGNVIAERPENVVGSYAVYHESKSGDYSKMGGKNYRAGKAFHIYRPRIEDANGNWTWGKLNIDERKGILTIEIDQNWLNKAVYPVKVDPTFGYTTAGSSYNTYNGVVGCYTFTPGESGNATQISLYGADHTYQGDATGRFGIYKKSDNSLAVQTVEYDASTWSLTPAWRTLDVTGSSSIENIDYTFALLMKEGKRTRHYWDSVSGYDQPWLNNTSLTAFPDPISWTYDPHYTDRKYSIYCTYTAGGGGEEEDKVIIGKGEDAYEIQIDDSLNLTGYINNQTVSTTITKAWHHIALTYDKENIKLYVDGVEKDSKSCTSSISTNTKSLKIGKNVSGTIDEVRIYNRALSAEEIRAHYLRGAGAHGVVRAEKFRVLDMNNNIPFIIDNTGNVGIGTTAPISRLELYKKDETKLTITSASSTDALIAFRTGSSPSTQALIGIDQSDSNKLKLVRGSDIATSTGITIDASGNVGIGTTTPSRKLEVLDGSNPQLRLTQSGSTYAEFQVAVSTGDLTLSVTGDDIIFNQPGGSTGANLWICEGDACPSVTLSGGGNLVVEGDIYYPTTGTPKRSIVLTASGGITPTTGGAGQTKVDGTNHSYYVLDFDDTSDEAAYWQWIQPDSYDNGKIDVTFYWEANATSGDVVWCFQSAGVQANNAEDIDPTLSTAICVTDTAQSDPNDLASVTISNATSSFSAGEYVIFKVFRDADNASDTMSGDARLVKVKIEYAVTRESD